MDKQMGFKLSNYQNYEGFTRGEDEIYGVYLQ